jgi:hypothetical protein
MLIWGKIHAGSETNRKVPVGSGYESGSDKNHIMFQTRQKKTFKKLPQREFKRRRRKDFLFNAN